MLKASLMVINMGEKRVITKLIFGFEGYAPKKYQDDIPEDLLRFITPVKGYTFHGYAPVEDKFSCIYIVKEALYLFSMNIELEEELNKDDISEKLRYEFKTNGHPLSENIRKYKEDNDRWIIIDAGSLDSTYHRFSKIYVIIKEKGNLNVYEDLLKEATFCFFIDKEEAIYLEDIMLREKATRSMRNETIYGGNIFMTCIAGSNPIISIPNRGFSFRFYNDEDYDKLLNMLTDFLNHTSLDEKLQNL